MCFGLSIIQRARKIILKGQQSYFMEKETDLGYGAPKGKARTSRWMLKGGIILFILTRYRGFVWPCSAFMTLFMAHHHQGRTGQLPRAAQEERSKLEKAVSQLSGGPVSSVPQDGCWGRNDPGDSQDRGLWKSLWFHWKSSYFHWK